MKRKGQVAFFVVLVLFLVGLGGYLAHEMKKWLPEDWPGHIPDGDPWPPSRAQPPTTTKPTPTQGEGNDIIYTQPKTTTPDTQISSPEVKDTTTTATTTEATTTSTTTPSPTTITTPLPPTTTTTTTTTAPPSTTTSAATTPAPTPFVCEFDPIFVGIETDESSSSCDNIHVDMLYLPTNSCTDYIECKDSTPHRFRCPCDGVFHFASQVCLPHLSWFYVDPDDCTRYWRCEANANFVSWHHFVCSADLAFNIWIEGPSPTCQQREHVNDCLWNRPHYITTMASNDQSSTTMSSDQLSTTMSSDQLSTTMSSDQLSTTRNSDQLSTTMSNHQSNTTSSEQASTTKQLPRSTGASNTTNQGIKTTPSIVGNQTTLQNDGSSEGTTTETLNRTDMTLDTTELLNATRAQDTTEQGGNATVTHTTVPAEQTATHPEVSEATNVVTVGVNGTHPTSSSTTPATFTATPNSIDATLATHTTIDSLTNTTRIQTSETLTTTQPGTTHAATTETNATEHGGTTTITSISDRLVTPDVTIDSASPVTDETTETIAQDTNPSVTESPSTTQSSEGSTMPVTSTTPALPLATPDECSIPQYLGKLDSRTANCPSRLREDLFFPAHNCSTFTVCSPRGASLHQCPCNKVFHFASRQCVEHLSLFYVDPHDCSMYWRCVANYGLVSWHHFTCQPGHGFNTRVRGPSPRCEPREQVLDCNT